MTIRTTCIGAYPKPDYIEIGNFVETDEQDDSVTRFHLYPGQCRQGARGIADQGNSRSDPGPDCGLMMLGRDLAMAKLQNMCAAAQAI